jgi:hypothetical protein
MRLYFAITLLAALSWAGNGNGNGNGGGNGGGGGGGGEPPPAGSIYFYGGALYTMDADGSNVAAEAGTLFDDPSNLVHGGHRWFLQARKSGVRGLYALRDDGATETLLLAESSGFVPAGNSHAERCGSGEIKVRWAKDDSFVSFIGGDGSGEGIFVADVSFDGSGVPSLTSTPAAVLRATDLRSVDWSPDGDQFVYRRAWVASGVAHNEIHVGTISGGSTTTAFLADGKAPEWSPVDDRIAYLYLDSLDRAGVGTIRADGSDAVTITSTGNSRTVIDPAYWSPDGAHLVYAEERVKNNHQGGQPDSSRNVFRIPSGGGSATEITPSGFSLACPLSWR